MKKKDKKVGYVIFLLIAILCFLFGLWFFGIIISAIALIIFFNQAKSKKSENRVDKTKNILNSQKIISKEIKKEKNIPSEIDLSNVPYIPLPPSPSSWELRQDKDQDFHDVYTTKENIKILDAFWEKKFNTVVSLIDTISPDECIGKIGDTFLKSYKKLIYRWTNKEKPLVALKWSSLMMEKLPKIVSDTDRRRHNKLIDSLDSKGISHSHKKYEIIQTPQNKEPFFMISDWCNWSILTEEKLPMTERPDPALRMYSLCLMVVYFLIEREEA